MNEQFLDIICTKRLGSSRSAFESRGAQILLPVVGHVCIDGYPAS